MAKPRRSSLARIGRRVSVALGFGKRRGASSTQQLQVHLLDGSVINLSTKPTTTVASVLVAVRRAVKLDLDCDFALYMTTGDGAFAALENDTRVQQVVAKLPVLLRGRVRFFYKRKVYIPGGQTEDAETRCSDPHQAAHRLAFVDAAYHYLQGNYRFKQELNITMSALLLQSHDGDFNVDRHGAENLVTVLPFVYPAAAIDAESGGSTPEQIAAAIAENHGDLRGLMPMEAQVTFLNKAKAHPAYGCDFFPCKRTWRSRDESGSEDKVKMRTEDVVVAIGKEGVHLWSMHDPFDIASHGYDVITKWTVSKDGKVFAFCVDEEVIVYLVTLQAATIESVIEHYVHDLVAMRSGLSRDAITAKDAGSAVVTQITPPPPFLRPGRFHVSTGAALTEAGVIAASAFTGGLKRRQRGGASSTDEFKASNGDAPASEGADTSVDEAGEGGGDATSDATTASAGAPASAAVPVGVAADAPQPPPSDGPPPLPPDDPGASVAPPVVPGVRANGTAGGSADDGAAPPAVDDVAAPQPPDDDDDGPVAPSGPADVAAAHVEPAAEVAPAPANADSSLADGWEEQVSSSGEVYYFNPETGESTWDKPLKVAVASAAGDGAGAAVATLEAAVAAPVGAAVATVDAEGNPLPAGWILETDADGYSYYVNTLSGESQWEPPTEAAVGPDGTVATAVPVVDAAVPEGAVVATVDAEGTPLPPGWIMETDADGYSYYVNTLTDASQWERPTEAAVGTDGTVAT